MMLNHNRLLCLLSLGILGLSACTPHKDEKLSLDPKEIMAEHAETWKAKNKSGLEALSKGDLSTAEKDLLVALKEAESCGKEDLRVAVTLNNLASVYENQKAYEKCPAYLQFARKIFRKSQGDSSEMVAVTERNEARILTKQNKWSESIPLYEEAVKSMTKNHSQDLNEVMQEYGQARSHVVPVK